MNFSAKMFQKAGIEFLYLSRIFLLSPLYMFVEGNYLDFLIFFSRKQLRTVTKLDDFTLRYNAYKLYRLRRVGVIMLTTGSLGAVPQVNTGLQNWIYNLTPEVSQKRKADGTKYFL